MKIKRISWWNYRGLDDGEIIAGGADVIVRGQNGVGKTSIASIVPFVLFDNERDKVKPFVNGEVTRDPNLYSGAEVEFDNEKILRREIIWTGRSNTTELYVDGAAVSKKAFDAEVELLTGKGGESVLNPFVFCELKPSEQRLFLMRTFGTGDKEPAPEFFQGQSADKVIASLKKSLKVLKDEAAGIPRLITENTRQLEDKPIDKQLIESLEAEKKSLCEERDKLFAAKSETESELATAREELAKISANDSTKRINQLERDIERTTRDYHDAAEETETLVQKYKSVYEQKKPGLCPTCGQMFPLEQFKKWKTTELGRIFAEGTKKRAREKSFEQTLNELKTEHDALKANSSDDRREKISELNERIKILSAQVAEENSRRREQKKLLDEKISAIDNDLGAINSVLEIPKRIEELRRQEKELNQRIVELEGQLREATAYRDRQIERLENRIAEQFEHVKFKMFELVQSTGECKPTCEAMLHGVPYAALSKGERLKAALDIWRTLQKVYNVELPLMIDDAESYTRNSFVDVANQLWLFKVSDEEHLVIEVKKEARSAA